jgi:hypothetical protein
MHVSVIRVRMQGVRWVADTAPYVTADRHLDADTPEEAYRNFGYQAALEDVLDLAQRVSEEHDTTGKVTAIVLRRRVQRPS